VRRLPFVLAGAAVWIWLPPGVFGQELTVQQPVVGSFSAATTVSVPDRGRAFIGGVSSAGASSTRSGPFPSGLSSGRFARSGSTSVSAFIHDFSERDRQALGATGISRRDGAGDLVTEYQLLLEQRRGTDLRLSKASGQSEEAEEPGTAEVLAARAKAERSLNLGRAAAERNDWRLAALHFRMAAKFGDPTAAELEREALRQAEAAQEVRVTEGESPVRQDFRQNWRNR